MIVFDLSCRGGHVFEAWFGSSADYNSQKERGLVACPLCGDPEVQKAVMAPHVGTKSNRSEAAATPPADRETVKAMLAELALAQKKILETSTHVGNRFADEARAIHLGETEARAIHGRATPREAERLAEEGIPVAPLPFPVAEPGEEN